MSDWFFAELKKSARIIYPNAPSGVFKVCYNPIVGGFLDEYMTVYAIHHIIMISVDTQLKQLHDN